MPNEHLPCSAVRRPPLKSCGELCRVPKTARRPTRPGNLHRWNGRGRARRAQGEMLHEHDRRGNDSEPGYREGASAYIFSCDSRGRVGWCHARQHPEHPHRVGDVFNRLLAEILVVQCELVLDLVMDGARDADAAGLRETLEARGDVDAVAVDLLAIDHHVPEVDADTKLHPALGWQRGILGLERGLDF